MSSLRTQRALTETTAGLNRSFERLASGLRISRASDDAAGLAVASGLAAQRRIFNQGIRNLNDGLSLLNIAEGAVQELSSILMRMSELAEQSANGVLSAPQRKALQGESDALHAEYHRIVASTSFNGTNLLATSSSTLELQAGGNSLILPFGLNTNLVGDGSFAAPASLAVSDRIQNIEASDINDDGSIDLVTGSQEGGIIVQLGNGNGTFRGVTTYQTGISLFAMDIGDVNRDGINDIGFSGGYGGGQVIGLMLGNANGSFQAPSIYQVPFTSGEARAVHMTDVNRDGTFDLITATTDGRLNVYFSNGDGTLRAPSFYSAPSTSFPSAANLQSGDLNGDGNIDLVYAGDSAANVYVLLGNTDGSFKAPVAYSAGGFWPNSLILFDFNQDGKLDFASSDGVQIRLGVGDGTFGPATNIGNNEYWLDIADINGDGFMDLVGNDSNTTIYVHLSNGDGTFNARTSFATGDSSATTRPVIARDFNNDGVPDILSTGWNTSNGHIFFGNGVQSPFLTRQNISNQDSARVSLKNLRRALDSVNVSIGNLGSSRGRTEAAVNNLRVSSENYQMAESSIMDVDVAVESAAALQKSLLQQAASSILSQANLLPSLALTLLRG